MKRNRGINIALDPRVHRLLKIRVAQDGGTFSEVIENLLKEAKNK